MSPDWRDVGPAECFPEGEPIGVEVEAPERQLKLAVVRHGGECHAVLDQRPHRGAPFSQLGLVDEQGHLVCSWHYWAFRLDDGSHTLLPDVSLCKYAVAEREGRVLVNITAPT